MNKRVPTLFLCFLLFHCANISKESTASSNNAVSNPNNPAGGVLASGLYLADLVVGAPGNTGTGFYDATKIINGVRGAGTGSGSLDVFSLDDPGYNGDLSQYVVLRWTGKKVTNGPGMDFIVFENAFYIGNNSTDSFMDIAFVEVSNDNVNYCGFAPVYNFVPATTYSPNPANWVRFAGRSAVLYNVDTNNLTAAQVFQDLNGDLIPDLAGGDGFDLDQLSADNSYATGCSQTLRDDLATNGFTYLRLLPASRRADPNTGAAFLHDPAANGPDFDGVLARYVQ